MSNVRLWNEDQDQPFDLAGRRVVPAFRRISYDGGTTEIEPRVMAVLLALAQRAGETVRRQELIDLVWNGAPGADQSLNNAISLLRRALHDADMDQRLIKTVPKQGYQLCAYMHPIHGGEENALPQSPSAPLIVPQHSFGSRRRAAIFAITFVALIGAFTFSTLRFADDPSTSTKMALSTADIAAPGSIAVLPFANFGADQESAYFADGLAEEILHALAQIETLSVASRTDSFQFRDSNTPVGEIAQRLGVANVLEGSVRRDGDRLRVTVQLIAANSSTHLWSSTYDRTVDDVLAIQQDIAINIANALAREISEPEREQLASLPTTDAEAYEHYLIGKHELRKWTPDGNRRAVRHLKQSIERDPEFAEAQLALGRAYYFAGTHYGWMDPAEAIPKVKASLIHGVSSENSATRSAALSIYGDVLAWSDQDWRGAIAAYERAYELSGTPPLGYGLTNSIVGNHDAAVGIFRKLLDDGAGSIGINGDASVRNNLAWAYFNARRYEDALREAGAVLSEDAAYADGYRVLGRAQLLLGQTDEAIAAFSEAARLMNEAPTAQSDLAVALARAGREEEARTILNNLLALDTYVPAPLIAQVYANIGDSDSAFDWLEKGIEDGARGVIFLKINPLYDPLREDVRYSGLLLQLNLNS
ncbi:tetratricopeptide repeat protein [Marinicaulis aureus]|uniref:Tetratricopeptide repeat protein n=1 Tax=Hyphococcus aureus TaxID=2666033 RepID=A0ABW1L4E7_9PROT